MNILMFYKDKPSLDPIIYPYLKKHAKVFILSKRDGDLTINPDDTIDTKMLHDFIKKKKITHFFYVENSAYVPIFLNEFPIEVTKVMLLIDTHINKNRRLPYLALFDLILLVNKQQVSELRTINPNIEWFTYGGDTKAFYKLPKAEKKYNVVFNGNIIPWIHYHRFFMLWYLRTHGVDVLYSTATYQHHNKLFNESKIVLNRTPLGGWNLRIFEAMSSGSLLMTDIPSNNMEKIFIDKKHLVYYNSFADLKNKIDYYLVHDKEREKIAKQGYNFVRRNYSWDAQINKLLDILKRHKYKNFTRNPYYLSLSNLECFSFRNKALALKCLRSSLVEKEINKLRYYYYLSQYLTYLTATDWIIAVLNFIRVHFLTKPFEK